MVRLNSVVTLDAFRALLEDYVNDLERRGDLDIHPELLPKQTLDTVAHRQARRMAKWIQNGVITGEKDPSPRLG